MLLDHAAADVDAAEAVSGKTALHLAVERGLEVGGRVMRLMLTRYIDRDR